MQASSPSTHQYQDCLGRPEAESSQSSSQELPGERNSYSKERSHWSSGTLFCTTTACCGTDSSSNSHGSQTHFLPFAAVLVLCGAATCHFWGNGGVKELIDSSIHLLQFQLFERKRSGLIFQSSLTVNGMRETSPDSNSPCQSCVGGMALCKVPSLTEGALLLSCIGSSLPNYYSKPFPEHLYWRQIFQPSRFLFCFENS